MVTCLDDTITPNLSDLALALLPAVTEASERLASTASVPLEVPALIEGVVDQLPLDDIGAGFADLDPYLGEAILAGALSCLRALRRDDSLEQRRMLRLGLERLRQALRDVSDQAVTSDDQPINALVNWLTSRVDLAQQDIANLLGVSVRTLQRWVSPNTTSGPTGTEAARVRIVCRITNHLRHVYTGPGVLSWFKRPHPGLSGNAPQGLLDDPTQYPLLTRLAAGVRSTTLS